MSRKNRRNKKPNQQKTSNLPKNKMNQEAVEDRETASWAGALANVANAGLKSVFSASSYVLMLALPSAAKAGGTCFQDPNSHSYTLDCGYTQQNLEAIINLLRSTCQIYTNGLDDCATSCGILLPCPPVDSIGFGSGLFAGSACTLNYYDFNYFSGPIQPDPCIIKILAEHVKNGYGSIADIFVTMAIVIGGGVALSGMVFLASSIRKAMMESDQPNERTALISRNDAADHSTSESEAGEEVKLRP